MSQQSGEQAASGRTGRRRRGLAWGAAGVAVTAAAAGISLAVAGGGPAVAGPPGGMRLARPPALPPAPPPGTDGYEGAPVPDAPPLAGTAAMAAGQTVDGIGC